MTATPGTALAQTPITPVRPIGADDASTADASANVSASGQLTFDRQIELRLGPFILRPGVGAGTGVQSNVTADVGGGTKLSANLFADAGPSLDVLVPIGQRHLFSVTSEAIYRWYAGNENVIRLNGWLYSGTGGYAFESRPFAAAATYSLRKYQEGLLAFLESGAGVEITDTVQRIDVRAQQVGARMRFNLSDRLQLQLQGTQAQYRYDETGLNFDVATELDRDETTADVLLDRRLTYQTTLGLFATATRSEYRSENSFRDNDDLRGGLRLGFSTGQAGGGTPLNGTIEAGVESRMVANPGQRDFTGPYAVGAVRMQLKPRVGLSLSADVRTRSTLWEQNTYSINKGAGLFVDVWALRRLNLGAGIDYERVDYPEPAAFLQDDGSILTAKRADQRWTYRARIMFRVFGVSLGLDGGYFERSSNFDIGTSRGYFFRLGLGAGVSASRSL